MARRKWWTQPNELDLMSKLRIWGNYLGRSLDQCASMLTKCSNLIQRQPCIAAQADHKLQTLKRDVRPRVSPMQDMILLSDVLVGVMGAVRRRHSSAAFARVGHHALNMLVRHGFGSTSRRLVNRWSVHLVVSRRRRLELLCGLLVPPPIHRVALLGRTVVVRVLVL